MKPSSPMRWLRCGNLPVTSGKMGNRAKLLMITFCAVTILLIVEIVFPETPMPQQGTASDSILQQVSKSAQQHPSGQPCYYCKGSTKVSPFKYGYTLQPQTACDKNTRLIVMVNSLGDNVGKRSCVRGTWGSVVRGKPWPHQAMRQKEVKLVFVMGEQQNAADRAQILQENATYGDILLGNFSDTYRNLTLKSLLAMKYVYEECPQAKYMLKSDDDVFVNLPALVQILTTLQLQRSVFGYISSNQDSDRKGKWQLSMKEFPFNKYPPYAWGAAYVISTDIVQEMFNASEYTRQFHVDDLYITGVLAKVVGANLINTPKFSVHDGLKLTPCNILQHHILIKHDLTSAQIVKVWRSLSDKPKCE